MTDPSIMTDTAALPERLGPGGAYCHRCCRPMREGTMVLRQPDGVLCGNCVEITFANLPTAAERLSARTDRPQPDGCGVCTCYRCDEVIPPEVVVDVRAVLDEREQLVIRVLDAEAERDGHRKRQIEAERALILLLAREGGRVEFTAKEMTRATGDGSFVSSRGPASGNEVLEFRVARSAPAGGLDDA